MSSNDLQHHAVPYKLPNSSKPQLSTIDVNRLRDSSIKYVRIQWVDLVNNIRYRVVPIDYFEKLLKTSRPGVSITKAAMGLIFITMADGFGPAGEYLYAIDPASVKMCPYALGHASVMGWFQEKTPTPGVDGHLAIEVDLCPRTILQRVIENAKRLSGVEFLVGYETEFILLKNTYPIEAVNQHGWSNSAAIPSGSVESKVLEEIVESLQASRVEIQMYHAEAAPGQYEIVPGPLPPLQAVDTLIHTRETIFNVASKYGLRATLAPRVFMDNCGSAAHTHISVHSSSSTPSSTSSSHPNLNHLESCFLAGLLAHLPSVLLLALPTTESFKRMMDGAWSGGTYVSWGVDNRETPVRLCNAGSPQARNFEIKTHDGTANPYLSLAGFLGAGMEGVLENKECTIEDCGLELNTSAALLGEEKRKEMGIKDRLPLTWEAARKTFEVSELVDSVFGKEFKQKFLSTNKTLREQMSHGLSNVEELKKYVENY
ncbi:hypothetical protein CPB83DRAFT_859515 [Crepidotus variabilis]|uniref:Glutamine synthetase n=1 Tax=Crepidotus variabilis TaxID=179855 RepID=A0A9P6JM85_9AGAR|nr:hypothetical protein CPB83DRAFT_859515 [Crepidotus variabilis]